MLNMDSFLEEPRTTPRPIPVIQELSGPTVPEVSLMFQNIHKDQTPSRIKFGKSMQSYNAWKLRTSPNNNAQYDSFVVNNTNGKENIFNTQQLLEERQSLLKKQVRFESPDEKSPVSRFPAKKLDTMLPQFPNSKPSLLMSKIKKAQENYLPQKKYLENRQFSVARNNIESNESVSKITKIQDNYQPQKPFPENRQFNATRNNIEPNESVSKIAKIPDNSLPQKPFPENRQFNTMRTNIEPNESVSKITKIQENYLPQNTRQFNNTRIDTEVLQDTTNMLQKEISLVKLAEQSSFPKPFEKLYVSNIPNRELDLSILEPPRNPRDFINPGNMRKLLSNSYSPVNNSYPYERTNTNYNAVTNEVFDKKIEHLLNRTSSETVVRDFSDLTNAEIPEEKSVNTITSKIKDTQDVEVLKNSNNTSCTSEEIKEDKVTQLEANKPKESDSGISVTELFAIIKLQNQQLQALQNQVERLLQSKEESKEQTQAITNEVQNKKTQDEGVRKDQQVETSCREVTFADDQNTQQENLHKKISVGLMTSFEVSFKPPPLPHTKERKKLRNSRNVMHKVQEISDSESDSSSDIRRQSDKHSKYQQIYPDSHGQFKRHRDKKQDNGKFPVAHRQYYQTDQDTEDLSETQQQFRNHRQKEQQGERYPELHRQYDRNKKQTDSASSPEPQRYQQKEPDNYRFPEPSRRYGGHHIGGQHLGRHQKQRPVSASSSDSQRQLARCRKNKNNDEDYPNNEHVPQETWNKKPNETQYSLGLQGSLEVQEPDPESPDNSIHIDMHEYDSESESDDECSSLEDGWTFYQDILGQVNNILENSPTAGYNTEKFAAKRNHHTDGEATNTTLYHNEYAKQSSVSEELVEACQLKPNEISFAVKQVLMKYMNDDSLANATTRNKQEEYPRTERQRRRPTDVSVATFKYQRYDVVTNAPPCYGRKIKTNPRSKKPSHKQKMGKTVGDPKILDITTLKQQPKLL